MYYTGIDLHKFTSYLTTVDSSGAIVKQADIKNVAHNFVQYFIRSRHENITTVESTMTWYWLNDLLTSLNIPLVLAHAKYVKAIAYAKVKTDKVDSHTLAQLLRMDYIPVAHKISNDKRLLRDALRARLKIVQRHTSVTNSMQLLLAKYNFRFSHATPVFQNFSTNNFPKLRLYLMSKCLILKNNFIHSLFQTMIFRRSALDPRYREDECFYYLLEVDDINRFPDVKNFFSYCRLYSFCP